MGHGCHDCGSPNGCECNDWSSRTVRIATGANTTCTTACVATVIEPMPIKNTNTHIADLVIQDINARKLFGMQKYGTALQPFNGRDALADAYQEALDLCKYLRQSLYE